MRIALGFGLSCAVLACGGIEGDVHATAAGGQEIPLSFAEVEIIPANAIKAPFDSACRDFESRNAPMKAKSESLDRLLKAPGIPVTKTLRDAWSNHGANARMFEDAMSDQLDGLVTERMKGTATADVNGHFRLSGLAYGDYFVTTRRRTGEGEYEGIFLRDRVHVPLVGSARAEPTVELFRRRMWTCDDTTLLAR